MDYCFVLWVDCVPPSTNVVGYPESGGVKGSVDQEGRAFGWYPYKECSVRDWSDGSGGEMFAAQHEALTLEPWSPHKVRYGGACLSPQC